MLDDQSRTTGLLSQFQPGTNSADDTRIVLANTADPA